MTGCWLLMLVGWLAAPQPSVRATTAAKESVGSVQPQPSPTLLTGQQALDETVFPGLSTKISLDLRGMDIVEVLKFLAQKGSFNVVTGPDVQGRATLTLTDVTVRDALDIVLVSNGLAIERRGSILYVMSGTAYQDLYAHRYGDPRQSLIVQLKYANPAQVGALLGNLKSAVGRIVIDEPTATIAILDTPGILAQMQTLLAAIDLPTVQRQVPTETRVIPLQFAKAEDVKSQIESVLTPEVGQLRLDKRSNALVVTEVAAKLPQIEQLIKAFDARNRQVYIESSILSVTLRDEFDTGIEWNWVSESKDFPDVTITNSLPIASDATNAIKLVVGTVAENDVTATIKALHVFGDTKVLSSPHIAAMSGEDARILVGRREAFVTSTVTQAQSTASTAETIQFIDVGVKLFVTPTVSDSRFVTLKIRPEVSSVASTLKTSTGNTIPIVETTEAETRLMVQDGTTVIIGGLMRDETALSEQKVPILGDLPVIGVAFKNRSDRIKKTELVILMTPHIMSGEELMVPTTTTARVDWPTAAR
jgi:type II secretory pathway component GspD/PulD (secretin)